MPTPTSYVVVAGPDETRAYFTDDGTLRAAAATSDGFDFDGAQPGVIGLDLLNDPKLATPAGNAVNLLRDTLTSLNRNRQAATGTSEEPAAA